MADWLHPIHMDAKSSTYCEGHMRNTMAKIIEDGLTAFQAALIEAAALVAECKATELDNLADNSAEIKFTRDYRAGARTARAIATDIRALKQPI